MLSQMNYAVNRAHCLVLILICNIQYTHLARYHEKDLICLFFFLRCVVCELLQQPCGGCNYLQCHLNYLLFHLKTNHAVISPEGYHRNSLHHLQNMSQYDTVTQVMRNMVRNTGILQKTRITFPFHKHSKVVRSFLGLEFIGRVPRDHKRSIVSHIISRSIQVHSKLLFYQPTM